MNIGKKTLSYDELCDIIKQASQVATSQRNSNIIIGMELIQIKVKNYIVDRERFFASALNPDE